MPASPNIGSELAGYRLDAVLGRGGMGVVYRAHDLALWPRSRRSFRCWLPVPAILEDHSIE